MKEIYVFTLVLLFLLTSCAATPDENIVKGKDSNLEDIVEIADDGSIYTAPSRWTENIESNDLVISIDAEVNIPSVTEYPIITIKQRPFTQEDVNHFIDILFKGNPVYE